MTHAKKISAFVAMGLLMAVSPVAAQKAPVTTSGGEITYRTMGQDFGVESSKFTEYRQVPSGTSIPYMNMWSTGGKVDFSLTGYNVSQKDQQYIGKANAFGLGLKFNVNSINHDLGNNARTIYAQSAPGVWSMSSTLRQALQNAVDAPGAGVGATTNYIRFLPNYQALLAPTFASANVINLNGVRRTGDVALNLGTRLPVDVTLTYRNELKTGYRGQAGINENFRISPALQVGSPLDEITNDFGLRAAKKFTFGSAYVTYNRNMYNNRAELLMIDYPFQAADAPVVAAQSPASATSLPSMGGPSREQAVLMPDNSANTVTAGFTLKFKRQTRINAGFSLSSRAQDAKFYGYTAYTMAKTANTALGVALPGMPQQSLNGKTEAQMINLSFSSRPLEGLTLRAQYRSYDLTDKTKRFLVPGVYIGTGWIAANTADGPQGFATANVLDTKTSRFNATASYDYKALTIEGQVRTGTLERSYREAEKGTESGMGVTALYHYNDWLGFRGTYDNSKRTAEGHTVYGYQADEAPLTNTRMGVDLELTPMDGLDFSVGYIKRKMDYTDRPNRCNVVSGACAAGTVVATPVPNTPSGLLGTSFDSYTGELNWTANTRLELGAYMTYEKDAQTNQWSSNPSSLTYNTVNYAGSNTTNTYGGHAVYHVIADKATLMLNAMNQKVDGLMDITAREAGSFYTPARTGLVPAGQGGAKDVDDWDDTQISTINAQFDYTVNKAWTMGVGYTFEKYDYQDAFTVQNNELLPVATIIFMKPNDGAYKVNLVYAKLTFKF